MIADPITMQKLLVNAVRVHNVLPLTGRCNLSCPFCSHIQNPPGTRAYDFPPVDESHLLYLAPYLNAGRKIVIGESATCLREGEPLTHHSFPTLIRSLRKLFPDTLIQVTTNGCLLNVSLVRLLSSLAPLELVFSLNSSTVNGRRLMMNDPRPLETLRAFDRVVTAGIPLHGSVVALPHLVGFGDLEQTLYLLNSAGARTIRLLLTGFTRLSPPALLLPPDIFERCFELTVNLTKIFQTPILLEPPQIDYPEPVIDGVLPGGPAALAALCAGDRILSIDGAKPVTRVEAFNLALSKSNPTIRFLRGDKRLETALIKAEGETPGFVASYDLDPEQVKRVRRAMLPAGETLMLTSAAALKRWQWARERYRMHNLTLVAVPSKFFGGTINCAGLLTVSDFTSALRQLQCAEYGAVLVPAVAFDPAGYDLQGRHYSLLNKIGAEIIIVD